MTAIPPPEPASLDEQTDAAPCAERGAAVAGTGSVPIDAAHVAELVALFGRRRLSGLMYLCLAVLRQGADELADARAAADFTAIVMLAHRLHGTAANFGLLALTETARALGDAARRRASGDVDALCARFVALVGLAPAQLEALIAADAG